MYLLDLHTIRHKDAEILIENFVISCSLNNEYPIEIITGNSSKMQEITIEVLDKHNFKYRIGDLFGNNLGLIYVYG